MPTRVTSPHEPEVTLRQAAGAPRLVGRQPFSCGVPFPSGVADERDSWIVIGPGGKSIDVQTTCLTRWPDGSVKWLLLVGLVDNKDFGDGTAVLKKRRDHRRESATPDTHALHVVPDGSGGVLVATGAVNVQLGKQEHLCSAVTSGELSWLAEAGIQLKSRSRRGASRIARVDSWNIEETGPIRASIVQRGRLRVEGLTFTARWWFFLNTGLVRLQLIIQNPSRARHAGGYWDLGDPGSVLLRELVVEAATSSTDRRSVSWILGDPSTPSTTQTPQFSIYQDSSGGVNWRSPNHVNRDGQVPVRFRGYRAQAGEQKYEGLRASPVVGVRYGEQALGCAVPEFWQKFPIALEVAGEHLRIAFWPKQSADLHELQGGEHCTRVIWFNFAEGKTDPCEDLGWTHSPAQIVVDPHWTAGTQAIAFLPSPDDERSGSARELADEALEGPHSFFAKREVIDEYGWRNYGDMWADHEEAYCDAPRPVISHYNNQYDLLHSMLVQYLLTGDTRWWQLADPLARHVMDIDIYHTSLDKSAYSGGMFWHTAHYHDAATSTHRSYSRKMRGGPSPAPGGGPSNEHNYTSGLLLYHQLTGDPRAREAVIGLADWVLAMDDGEKHVLGLVTDIPTGNASSTRDPDYHGPGRGAGNSLNALVDGWQATASTHYLTKANELLRRTIHPHDDIEARDLLNVEDRWSYTVYLQSLARFIEITDGVPQMTACRRYAVASLLRYASWVAAHERLYLDHPEQLEYLTETWAAQDLRKGNVLLHAARLATGAEERALFVRRGKEILDDAWRQLMKFETCACTRPLAVVLQQGYVEPYLRNVNDDDVVRDNISAPMDFGSPEVFHSQKQQVRAAIRSPQDLLRMIANISRLQRWRNVWRRSWTRQRLFGTNC